MIRGFTVDDGSVLFGLLSEGAGDILLKTDEAGFITEASPSLEMLGVRLEEWLLAPHIADLARPSHSDDLRCYCAGVLAGERALWPFEFPAVTPEKPVGGDRWFSLTLRPVAGASPGLANRAIAIMRAIERRGSLEDELLAASMVDQLTGLSNRQAFMETLSRSLASDASGSMILFGIDRFRAITLRYGRSRSDEVLWAFAQFLRTILGEEPILARLDGERFAAILPDKSPTESLDLARTVVATFADLSAEAVGGELRVAASAGVAAMAGGRDEVIRTAELSLTLSQAAGGARADLGGTIPVLMERRRSA